MRVFVAGLVHAIQRDFRAGNVELTMNEHEWTRIIFPCCSVRCPQRIALKLYRRSSAEDSGRYNRVFGVADGVLSRIALGSYGRSCGVGRGRAPGAGLGVTVRSGRNCCRRRRCRAVTFSNH